jgi:hypothetical protein
LAYAEEGHWEKGPRSLEGEKEVLDISGWHRRMDASKGYGVLAGYTLIPLSAAAYHFYNSRRFRYVSSRDVDCYSAFFYLSCGLPCLL